MPAWRQTSTASSASTTAPSGHRAAGSMRSVAPVPAHVPPLPPRGLRARRHAHDGERNQREDPVRRETPSLPPEDERDGGGQRAGDALAEHGADEAEERRRIDPAPVARRRVVREA